MNDLNSITRKVLDKLFWCSFEHKIFMEYINIFLELQILKRQSVLIL